MIDQPSMFPVGDSAETAWDQTFHDLMPNRVREVLLVSSHYDAFTLEEDGRLSDRVVSEYSELNLSNAPRITHVSTGARAMRALAERRFDLVLTMVRIPDIDVSAFGRGVKQRFPNLPVVLLVLTEADLGEFPGGFDPQAIDVVFWWTGNATILLAIIKLVEDRQNFVHDIETGVRAILVVEDSVRYYSSFLTLLYVELMKQSESLAAEGLNDLHRLGRMRARPKVLLARTYEEATALYLEFGTGIAAIISDVSFSHDGHEDPNAGYELVGEIRSIDPEVAILLQSADPGSDVKAAELGAAYASKKSPNLLGDIRQFVNEALGLGDFVFRMPDRSEVGRARHAFELEQQLATVPAESIQYHATHDHFSLWLTARCLFSIARKARLRKATDFGGPEAIRAFLIQSLAESRARRQEGVITDFSPAQAGAAVQFVRVGSGSIGGKARGLAFLGSVIARHKLADHFPGLSIRVPASVGVSTEEFERFVESHHLVSTDREAFSYSLAFERCMAGRLSDDLRQKLRSAVVTFKGPLAVRSSSILEDSQLRPFAGIYATYMIPNNHPDPEVRLDQVCDAVKAVFASTYSEDARAYLSRTPYSIEEEKMAVLIQEVVGQRHGDRFYPDIGGVAVSYNYYPVGHQRAEDGLAMVALGLGQTIVEGGMGVQFSPSDPSVLPQFGSARDYLQHTQRNFAALDLGTTDVDWHSRTGKTRVYDLADAEADGTLALVGSVYSSDEDVLKDDLHQSGPRLVTFHNVLKWNAIPLAPALARLLAIVRQGMGCAVEIEFALDAGDWGRSVPDGAQRREPTLYLLQVRPQATTLLEGLVDVEGHAVEDLVCSTRRSLGHGIIDGIRDIIQVKRTDLQATETPDVARQVGELNRRLAEQQRPYVLVGPGRWGSADPRLGIPVKWSQISGAKVIVEVPFDDRVVEPSQGAHFFHNVTSSRIGYLTLPSPGRLVGDDRSLDEEWLSAQRVEAETPEVRHIALDAPLHVVLDGRISRGVILKP